MPRQTIEVNSDSSNLSSKSGGPDVFFWALIVFAFFTLYVLSGCNRKASISKSNYDSTAVAKYDSTGLLTVDSTSEKSDRQISEEDKGFVIDLFGGSKGTITPFSMTVEDTASLLNRPLTPYIITVEDSAGFLKISSTQPIKSVKGKRKTRTESSQNDSTGLKKQQAGNVSAESKTSVKTKEKEKATDTNNGNMWKFLSLIGFLIIVAAFIIVKLKVK